MAIAFDASSSGQGAEPLTVNHTPTGTPTVVTAQAAYRNDQAVTSWQYGGTDMVEEASVLNTVRVRIAQLVAPSSGAQDCVLNLASAVARLAMSVHSYTGTVDADPVDGATTTTGTSTQAALTVTSRTDDLVVDAVCFTGDTVPTVNIVVSGGQDSREVQKIGNNTNGIEFGSSTEAGATSVGVSWDVDNSLIFAYAAVNVRAGATGQTVNVGQATETDVAQAVVGQKSVNVGQSLETDSAFAATVEKEVILGLSSEVDSAFEAGVEKSVNVGLASELDEAFALQGAQNIVVGLAEEADVAFATTIEKVRNVGLSTELNEAFAVIYTRALQVGLAIEIDTAFVVTVQGAGGVVLFRKLISLTQLTRILDERG